MARRERLHALDALRAAAMLLGIVWHAALFVRYIEGSLTWPTESAAVAAGADLLIVGLHVFRMPLFFVLAGFFAALVVSRSGARPFARARLKRIGVPLLVGYLTIVPLTRATMAAARGQQLDASLLVPAGLGVVWFLWYLLLLYAVALGLRRLKLPAVDGAHAWLVRSPLRVPLLAVPTALLLAPMDTHGAATPNQWTPDPLALAYFGVFFGFGWLLNGRQELIGPVGRRPGAHLVVAAVLAVLLVFVARNARTDHGWEPVAIALESVLVWSAIFGCFGLFERVFAVSRPSIRYLADASYWLYLTHGPLVIALDVVLLRAGVPLPFVILGSALAASAVLLLVYHWAVRYGAIGRLLHGPRTRHAWTDGRVSAFEPRVAAAD